MVIFTILAMFKIVHFIVLLCSMHWVLVLIQSKAVRLYSTQLNCNSDFQLLPSCFFLCVWKIQDQSNKLIKRAVNNHKRVLFQFTRRSKRGAFWENDTAIQRFGVSRFWPIVTAFIMLQNYYYYFFLLSIHQRIMNKCHSFHKNIKQLFQH